MTFPIHSIPAATAASSGEYQQYYIELRADGLSDAEACTALDEFKTFWQASPWPMDRAWTYWRIRRVGRTFVTITASTGRLTTALRDTQAALVMLAVQLHLRPCSIGLEPCFCHTKPFRAARDYRRRTKHRRRRQR